VLTNKRSLVLKHRGSLSSVCVAEGLLWRITWRKTAIYRPH